MTPIAQLFGGPQPPKNRAELEALIAKRDELQAQLSALNENRGDLASQVERLGTTETRAAPLARLKETDQRIARLETDLNATNELITSSMGRMTGRPGDEAVARVIVDEHRPPVEVYTSAGEPWQSRGGPELIPMLPITLGTVLLLGVLMYWRISASMKRQFAQMIATQSGRFEELQRSVDTVAVEVERVSENQRFVTKLVGEKQPAQAVERR